MIAERLSYQPYKEQFIAGISAAQERLGKKVEVLHLAYDLKVSTEFCKAELARRCAENLGKIQGESVVGIHLSDEEVNASLTAENWELVGQASYGPDTRRMLKCRTGKHQLRADIWTDMADEIIQGISIQLVVQAIVRNLDGSEQPRMFDGDLVTLLLDERWELGKSLLRYPSM